MSQLARWGEAFDLAGVIGSHDAKALFSKSPHGHVCDRQERTGRVGLPGLRLAFDATKATPARRVAGQVYETIAKGSDREMPFRPCVPLAVILTA